MYRFRRYTLPFLIFVVFALLPQSAFAVSVHEIRLGQPQPDTYRIVVETGAETDFSAFLLDTPRRLVLDIPNGSWKAAEYTGTGKTPIVNYRFGTPEDGTGRIVFDLQSPVRIETAFLLPKAQFGLPDRIVIDLQKTDNAGFAAELETLWLRRADTGDRATTVPRIEAALTVTLPVPQDQDRAVPDTRETEAVTVAVPLPARKPVINRYTIVIDPGHGGRDPGAVNGNIYEKNITLALAREIKKQLEATGRYTVTLTRDRDVFVALRERVAIARKAGADLFISLHADKIARTDVRGSSVYTLSREASDKETANLAENANRSDIIAGIDLSDQDEDVANILIDLAMSSTMNYSNAFANTLVETFRKNNMRLVGRPHRSAGFAVLTAADTPSVLLEAGFLSNREEAVLLNSPAHQRRLAGAVRQSIDAYFNKVEAAALH
ncbi:MAG: N-acetylmuramoyl-L-alanine amidase [Micavibrio sp.]|nr:MAG: N-acetylmuramoyl-L-alanine amidase [Micavibrio sp.]